MEFASPWAFWFFTAAGPVALFYLFRRRLAHRPVPCLRLWEKVLSDSHTLSRLQPLRRPFSLLLQIVLLSLLVFAAAHPRQPPARSVLVLDTSASMTALEDDGRQRFKIAQDKALALVAEKSADMEMMLVAAGREPRVIVPYSADAATLTAAIRGLTPSLEVADVSNAVSFAREVTAGSLTGKIHLFSDRYDQRDTSIVHHAVGETSENAGIVNFRARRIGGATFLQVAIRNYAKDSREIAFAVDAAGEDPGGRPLAAFRETVPAGGTLRRVVDVERGSSFRLRITAPAFDALAADNVAWTSVATRKRQKVLLVSRREEALFLGAALARIGSRIVLEPVEPDAYAALPPEGRKADITIFNRVAVREKPRGNVLYIDCTGNSLPVQSLPGTIEGTTVTDWDRHHPINRFLHYQDLQIVSARPIRLLGSTRPLVSGSGGPLITLTEHRDFKAVYVAFDLSESGFPIRAGFPIFLANLMAWFAGETGPPQASHLYPGEPIVPAGPLPEGVETVVVRYLEAEEEPRRVPVFGGSFYFADTHRPGRYEVTIGSNTRLVNVNAVSAKESDIAPRRKLDTGKGLPPSRRLPRSPWSWLCIAAIGLFLVEWFLYQKRITE